MRAGRTPSLALLATLLFLWAALAGFVRAQGPSGHLAVSTDYELFGTSQLRGGGHVTWTLSGDKATDLRGKILHLFDTYRTIPRGFPSGGTGTNGNQDGRLDAAEGVVYTNLLEERLEAAGRGTTAQYLQLYPFDLRDKVADEAASFVRSTTGLANTTQATNADVEIRFLFQANSTADGSVPLATSDLADALYSGFSYRAAQSPTLAASGPYPGTWPFLPGGGWHIVNATGRPAFWSGRPAFWAGNDSTGGYEANVNASMLTSVDPLLAPASPAYDPFDFRYASRAWATFNYTGFVGPGDALRLEYAHPPAYTDWTGLPFSLPPSNASWSNVIVDLNGLLGQVARLRLRFVSDSAGPPSTVFLRDFVLAAPAAYTGEVVESDTHYLIGTLGFSNPQVPAGALQVIRTPGGEILTYSARWTGSPPTGETISFRTFDVTENPQILSAVMLIASYGISRMQESAYETYREDHPAVYRPLVHRSRWIHHVGRVAIGVLVLFYFVPTALGLLGLPIFVGGLAYLSLAIGLLVAFGVGTRAYYARHPEQLPAADRQEGPLVHKVVLPAALPSGETSAAEIAGRCSRCLRDIHEGDPTYECTCAAPYHVDCAKGLTRCSNCNQPIAATVHRERKPITLRCESCGESQSILEGIDPRAATCPACGGRLRHLDEGKRYLVVARDPAIAFAWIRDLAKAGRPALCFSAAAPERLKLEFGIKSLAIIQVSSTAVEAIDPKSLDPLGLRAILPLARQEKSGVVLYDGLDEVIEEASFGDVIRFLRKANDMAFVHGVTVIARIAPGRLEEGDVRRLNAEFDEYLDLSGQL